MASITVKYYSKVYTYLLIWITSAFIVPQGTGLFPELEGLGRSCYADPVCVGYFTVHTHR